MPFPKHPLTLHGGCNCRSIRYKISIPEFSQRPLSIYCNPSHISEENRLPFTALDHCNDCRRATGALIGAWLLCPTDFLEVSCLPRSRSGRSSKEVGGDEKEGDEEREWVSGAEIFRAGVGEDERGWLGLYESSKGKYRGFCGKCGTSLVYFGTKFPAGWPSMRDVVLGTLDRGDLEKYELRPERQLWWDCGVPWVRDLVAGCEGMPKHPQWKMNETVE